MSPLRSTAAGIIREMPTSREPSRGYRTQLQVILHYYCNLRVNTTDQRMTLSPMPIISRLVLRDPDGSDMTA